MADGEAYPWGTDDDLRRKNAAPAKVNGNGLYAAWDRLKLKTASELFEEEFRPLKWAIPDLVPEGLTILAGRPKFGKSWLALDFAIAAASGGNAVGTVPCKAGPVLYLAMEDTDRRLQERMRAVLQGAEPPDDLEYATEWRRMDNGGVEDLRMWLQSRSKHDARLVIIDTFQKLRGAKKRDAGVYEDDYSQMGEFKKLADEYTVPVMVLTHENKAGNEDPVMAVSGTAGLTGAADTIMVLRRESRTDPNAVLSITGRDVIGDEIALQQDMQTGKWLKLGKADDFRVTEERRAIIRALVDHAGEMTPKEIADSTGKKSGNIRRLLPKMVREGEIVQRSYGKYSV